MITFSQYLDKFKKKFVGLDVDKASQDRLREWCLSSGFDLSKSYSGKDQSADKFGFHITVFFTTTTHDTTTGTFKIEPFELKFNKFELLGKSKDVPVMKVDMNNEPLLAKRALFERMGYKDEWPAYLPHVSLSYNYDGEPDLKTLKLPDFPVMVDTLQIKDQDD